MFVQLDFYGATTFERMAIIRMTVNQKNTQWNDNSQNNIQLNATENNNSRKNDTQQKDAKQNGIQWNAIKKNVILQNDNSAKCQILDKHLT